MALYEFTLLARQDISSQQAEALVEHFTGVIEANEGKVSKFENWGLRTSAHKIKKNRKAHYLFLNIDAPSAAMTEMERQMSIHEDVLRFLSIRVEEHEEGPSAMMRKSERDERGPRRDDRGPRRDDRGPRRDNRDNNRDSKPATAPAAAPAAAAKTEGDA